MADKNIKQFTESMVFNHPKDHTKEILVEAGDYYRINDDGTITLLSESEANKLEESTKKVKESDKFLLFKKPNIKDFKVGDEVAYKDIDGEFTKTGKVTKIKNNIITIDNRVDHTPDELRVKESIKKDEVKNLTEEVDVEKIIDDLADNFGADNEKQMAGVQLLKGLATSDDPKANEFMKKLDQATTEISKEMSGEEKVEESVDKIDEALTAYKITFEDGSTMSTSMASTVSLEDAKKYYIGQYFNMGVYPKEKMLKAVKVEKLR